MIIDDTHRQLIRDIYGTLYRLMGQAYSEADIERGAYNLAQRCRRDGQRFQTPHYVDSPEFYFPRAKPKGKGRKS
jgi:hypothetical protein